MPVTKRILYQLWVQGPTYLLPDSTPKRMHSKQLFKSEAEAIAYLPELTRRACGRGAADLLEISMHGTVELELDD